MPPSTEEMKQWAALFANKRWRMNNLYKIKGKESFGDDNERVVTMKLTPIQETIVFDKHPLKVIPKARQHGVTTCIAISYLDDLLFDYPNGKGSIIAHRERDALKIFASKIKFPYENINPLFKEWGFVPFVKRITSSEIEFTNGSIYTADTMVRSDTLSHLHISELAKMGMQFPHKELEVRTGALPAAEKGIISIESTMEGNFGMMYEFCEKARDVFLSGDPITKKDYKYFFFPWYQNTDYQMNEECYISPHYTNYFKRLKEDHDINLSHEQKWWYVKISEQQGEKMMQEYPSTYEEAISVSNEGIFFSRNLLKARTDKRITFVPYEPNSVVYCAMDLGYSDATSIWMFQLCGKEIHFIEYYEDCEKEPDFYMNWLLKKPYAIKEVILPHDAKASNKVESQTYEEKFIEKGFDVLVLERDKHEILGINEGREAFHRCWFDQTTCKAGLQALNGFHKMWDEKHGCYKDHSVHDKHSHGAKAFIYAIQGINNLAGDNNYTIEDIRKMQMNREKIF